MARNILFGWALALGACGTQVEPVQWEFHREPPIVVATSEQRLAGPVASMPAPANNLGMSYLGMCHPLWPCRESIQVFDGVPVVRFGWLARTFGDACPCVERLLSRDERPKQFRVHIANGPCLRNQRCGPYEIFAGETVASASRKIERRDRVLLGKFRATMQRTAQQIKAARGPVECFVSPCLECDLSDDARRVLFTMAAEIFPSCRLVDSVFRPRCLKGLICERHGADAPLSPPCIADLDGEPASQVDVRAFARRFRRCITAHCWTEKFNLLDFSRPGFQDPRRRTTPPRREDFRQCSPHLRPRRLAEAQEAP